MGFLTRDTRSKGIKEKRRKIEARALRVSYALTPKANESNYKYDWILALAGVIKNDRHGYRIR